MGWDKIGESECSVAKSLAVIGDRWTILLIRELLRGPQRFDRLQDNVKVSPHLLSMRLKRLEEEGVIKRQPYQERPVRYEYLLTMKGRALYPVLVTLAEWGAKWCGCNAAEDKPATEPDLTKQREPVSS